MVFTLKVMIHSQLSKQIIPAIALVLAYFTDKCITRRGGWQEQRDKAREEGNSEIQVREDPISEWFSHFDLSVSFYRVFKKSSPNGKLSLYVGKRDFVDHVDHVEPIDGIVLIDPEYLKNRKAFVTLTCAFRYGRDDMDLIGLSFRKDLYSLAAQVYPPQPEEKRALTPLQEKLMKKLGDHAHPFYFQMATNLPCSVSLQPGAEDSGKCCGVDFEIKGFCAENLQENICKRNSVRLMIRKVQFAPENTGLAPTSGTTRQFMMSDKPLHLEASLDKEVYYHGEPINVNVKINNSTSKTVKKIKVTVEQITDVVLFSLDKYTKVLCAEETNDTVAANSTLSKTFVVTPVLANNREKRGLALDGKLKHEDTNLASSTVLRPGMDKDVLGILVSYKVKVNLVVSRGGILGGLTSSNAGVEVPLMLMHPKLLDEGPRSEEDIVFEQFARQKLHGEDEEEEREEADAEES
uniref:Arrestin-C n=1 Tax=Geotrypetes seraphini TaxID=260995 RepID=A0A6P8QWF6_GEOSA|nr:arrestin-C [Geotrypetes seraphini]